MIPVDIRNVNNLSNFSVKMKPQIPDGCPCIFCRAFLCQAGYIKLTDAWD